jgi:hypothetical protein
MKVSIKNFQIFSAIFVMILGTLLHFTYEWSEGNLLVASFSAVNESTWEHLKLLFYPMLLTTIIGYFYFSKTKHIFLCANTIGILTAVSFTTVFFYTYTGIIGTNFAFLDIGSFFIAVIFGEFVIYKLLLSNFSCNKKTAFIVLLVLLLCFILFTYATPEIGLFRDPVSNEFGIQ